MFYVLKSAGLGNARMPVNVNMFHVLNEKLGINQWMGLFL